MIKSNNDSASAEKTIEPQVDKDWLLWHVNETSSKLD